MFKATLIIIASAIYAGIFESTNLLEAAENIIIKASKRTGVFPSVLLTSFFSACFACNQTLAIFMTQQLTKGLYTKNAPGRYQQAVDIENSAVVVAPLVPWSIACLVPSAALAVSVNQLLPYTFFLFLLPLINIFTYKYIKTSYR